MENIISNNLHLITRLAGMEDFRNLGPFILSGRVGRDAAYDTTVLKVANIDDFLLTPQHINLRSRFRPFFERCLISRNPTALYLEALRLACQGGSMEHVLQMLREAAPNIKHAIFAASIFSICTGNPETVDEIMAPLCRSHQKKPLYTVAELAEAEQIARMIFWQTFHLGWSRKGRFKSSWNFGSKPDCVNPCLYGPNCTCLVHCQEEASCGNCFFYWNSLKMCEFC